jgi:hypothetical protein
LRWDSPKATVKTLRRRIALAAKLRRAAHLASRATPLCVAGLRAARLGRRWRVARERDDVSDGTAPNRPDEVPPKALSSLDTNELTRPSRETCVRSAS